MEYPFIRCLHPKRIRNPYTKEWVTTPCNHCKACLTRKANRYKLLCDLERNESKYALFVTLTFSDEYIPKARLLRVEKELYDVVDDDTGEILGRVTLKWRERLKMLAKFNMKGYIPYLRKFDLQKFIKRLRYEAKKQCDCTIRHYSCGEYGPKHFRPHYHLILYFESEEFLQKAQEIISAKWPFGRVDVQTAGQDVSSYVSGYVSSFSFVPRLLSEIKAPAFCLHSQRLGFSSRLQINKETYQKEFHEFIQGSAVCAGKYTAFNWPRAYTTYFYPKCKGYANSDDVVILQKYQLVDSFRKFINFETITELNNRLFESYENHFFNRGKMFDKLLYSFFEDYPEDVSHDSDTYKLYKEMKYHELLVSNHFLYICKECNFSTIYFLRKIKEFYKQYDYMMMSNELTKQERYFTESNQDDYVFFYDNVYQTKDIKETDVYVEFSIYTDKLVEYKTKHKLQNDINKLLFN